MNKSKVRCWRLDDGRGGSRDQGLYITYPEDNAGHSLFSCLQCGHIYSASVAHQVYVGPPLEQKLLEMACVECGASLSTSIAPYPDRYLSAAGVAHFQRPMEMPPDSDSIVAEFDEIYG